MTGIDDLIALARKEHHAYSFQGQMYCTGKHSLYQTGYDRWRARDCEFLVALDLVDAEAKQAEARTKRLSLCNRAMVKLDHGTEYVVFCTFAVGHSDVCSYDIKGGYTNHMIPKTVFIETR